VAPANLLVDRGHDVTYVVPSGFHRLFGGERFSLQAYPVDFSADAMHADQEHQRLMRHPILNAGRLARYWMRKALVSQPDEVRTGLLEAFRGADVVVSHATMAVASAPVARSLGIPLVVGHLFPMAVPTATWSFPVSVLPHLGVRGNRALWNVYTRVLGGLVYDRPINGVRRRLGVEPLRGNVLTSWMDADRTVLLVSRHYYPEDGPAELGVAWGGFSHWAGPADQEPDPEVAEYLAAGDPPVLVTLGTSAATNAGDQFAAIASGLDDLGLRSLLLVGSPDNMAAVADRDGAFVFAPLSQVLAGCRLAVISGSLGTTGAALATGVPVVVVPQLFDQVWHGERAQKLGVGEMVFRTREVVAAVARVDGDPAYRERAGSLAAAMLGDDGAVALADAVESMLDA
jgi:sterol 3beta-glucosyltransferase